MKNKPFLMEVWDYMKVRKKYWLLPTIVILIMIAVVIIGSQNSYVAPFIYALF